MEQEESNNLKSTSKVWPIMWTTLTIVTVSLACLSGVAGYVAAMLSLDIVSELLPFYIQCGTTFLMFIISICEAFVIVTVVRWMKRKMNINKRRRNEMTSAVTNPFQEATLQNGPFISSYREFSTCDILGIYIGVIGINIGIVLVLWCITIAQNYGRHPKLTGSLWPFIVTDITTGLVSPILIIFSIIPITRIVRYVSHNRLETRKILLWFLPFLGYEKGSKGVYWVLEDSFYYKVHNGFCGSLSTALIYTTAGLTFLFSWVYFINDVFVKKTGLSSCMQLNQIEKETTYCFHIHPTDLNLYVNCTANNSYNDHLFCFEFKEAGINANIIQSLVISIILYYISVICISLTFQIMKCLQQYAHSYLWSTFVVMIGFFICLIGVVHFVSAFYFKYYLNVLTLFQIFIISANIIVVGILVAGGQLMQNQQSFSENTSILLNYRVNGDSFTVPNQDDAEFVHIPDNIPVLQTIEDNTNADIPHPIDQSNPQDTPLTPISDGTPPASLPPPSPSNSIPPPSSTPPPPLTSSPSSLETSSTITSITKPSITTSDSLVTNKTNGGNVMQQITDVNNSHMVHAATNKVMIPRTVYVRNPQSSLQMHRIAMSDASSGAAMPFIPVSSNYVVLTDQRTDRAIRVPTVQYTNIPSQQAVVPMQVFVPNNKSNITGPSVTELPPKRITIV